VDHEGEVLEVFATKRRDRAAALKFLKRTMKRYGRPWSIVTDRLQSYGAAIKVIKNSERQECGVGFGDIKTLQKFANFHASIHNHCSQERYLGRRGIFKQNRSAAVAE
jgi:putative transposase